MKVVHGTVTICSGSVIPGSRLMESPADLNYNGQRMVQESTGLRWTQSVMRDRKNAKGQLSFNVTRSHGTIQKAEQFVLTHELQLPNLADLKLTCDDGSGTNVIAVTMPNAMLVDIRIKQIGQLTMTSYAFKGGKLAGPTLT